MAEWRSSIVHAEAESIHIRGYEIGDLMRQAGFVDVIFLLHRGRLPQPGERKMLNAILVGVADHGAGAPSCAAARLVASGNRQSLSAAVAAGLLAVGDEHGGAGARCMEMIATAAERTRSEGLTASAVAAAVVAQARHNGRRLPGLGHRVHSRDPRVAVLLDLARAEGLAGLGAEFMTALEAAAAAAIKPLPLNIDGALAAVLYDLGFPPAAGVFLFLIGRVAGLTAEVAEEYAREKPMRIRFAVEYDGEPPRSIGQGGRGAAGG